MKRRSKAHSPRPLPRRAQLAGLREIASRMKHKSTMTGWSARSAKASPDAGVTALFAGPSGSGKTMAAAALANDLNLALYRFDLRRIVSKYIGETEKNLERVFE